MTTQKTHIKILTPAYGGNLTTHYFHSTLEFITQAFKKDITVSVDTQPLFSYQPGSSVRQCTRTRRYLDSYPMD